MQYVDKKIGIVQPEAITQKRTVAWLVKAKSEKCYRNMNVSRWVVGRVVCCSAGVLLGTAM